METERMKNQNSQGENIMLSDLLRVWAFTMPIALSACGRAEKVLPAVSVVDNSCSAFKQLSWSVNDTPQTSTQVRQHNATYSALCPKAKE